MFDTFVAVDIETTGLSPEQDKIIEIGALKIVNGKVTDEFSKLINPKIPISDKIASLTGITDELLINAPNVDEVLDDFLKFSGNNPVLGHNIIFDYSFLKVNYNNLGILYERYGMDTLKLSRNLHSELESKSLGNMCKYYGINNEHAHRAFDDAKATYELYVKLKNNFEKKVPEYFVEEPLIYKLKKKEPITIRQKNYLNDLVKYHKIELIQPMTNMSKSEASRLIDKIILSHGRILQR